MADQRKNIGSRYCWKNFYNTRKIFRHWGITAICL